MSLDGGLLFVWTMHESRDLISSSNHLFSGVSGFTEAVSG